VTKGALADLVLTRESGQEVIDQDLHPAAAFCIRVR